jgi:hypothetical protein
MLYVALPRYCSFSQVLSLPSEGPKTARNIVSKEMHIEYLNGHTFHLQNSEYANRNYLHM